MILLGRKYGRKWKEVAWKMRLLRQGRERRRKFAQSMQGLALSSHQRRSPSTDLDKMSTSKARGEDGIVQQPQTTAMPPPPRPTKGQGTSKSIPTETIPQHSSVPGHRSDSKSQRRGPVITTEPAASRITKVSPKHHKRSTTAGDAGSLHRSWKTASSSASSLSAASNSVLRESIMAKARHLLAGRPTDTTRTDYFRLKAMGIDPDTPSVPAMGSKRTRNEFEVEAKKAQKMSPAEKIKPSSLAKSDPSQMPGQIPPSASATRQVVDDPDEELLAQMRRAREAMSESISWFQEERAKSEFSRSSSESRPETAKERRLREWAPTPSRTEQRLAITGGHGLIPKDFGVSRSSRRATEERMISGLECSQPQGFPDVITDFDPDVDDNFDRRVGDSGGDLMAKGSSAEDAIEL